MNAPLTLLPRSSLGSKFLMALTGLSLTGFVIAHMIGNLQVFAGRDALNAYAQALKHMPVLLWSARIGLLAIFVAHIVYGIRLYLLNRAARPVPYHLKAYRRASVASRTMLWTGLLILGFVIFHLLHYTFGVVTQAPVRDPGSRQVYYKNYLELQEKYGPEMDPKYRADVYEMTIYGFRNPLVSLFYVALMAVLAYHLSHGFQSLFQSLGLSHPRWSPLVKIIGLALAVIIFVGNSSMPLAVLFRIIGTDVPS